MDPKKILGVGANATKEEIQRAYREKVKKHHPDLGGDAWAFQQVQEAYETLLNPKQNSQKRANKPARPTNKQPDQPKRKQTNPPSKSSPYRQVNKKRKMNSKSKMKHKPQENRSFWQLFSGELPLQSETAWFILINCLDIFMTYRLLDSGAIEANPIADYFYKLWGFNGMIAFKLAIVAIVCVIAQIVALKKINTAKALLWFGTFLVGCVVVYSSWLWATKFAI